MPPEMPAELRVLFMLRARVPHLQWDARRVIQAARDYRGVLDVEEVAALCADWMLSGQGSRVKDGPGTLRRFLKTEKEGRTLPPQMDPSLERYDTSRRISG